CLQYNSDPLTC
nr:immunoglobulin light chain junction region [Macaca mulatta]MPN82562.1 immunoglobulin light chain junction region [Macaca mulatta]